MLKYRRETYCAADLDHGVRGRRPSTSSGMTFAVKIGAHGELEHGVEWSPQLARLWTPVARSGTSRGRGPTSARHGRGSQKWIDDAPRLECDDDDLKATYRRSLVDLAALRFSPRPCRSMSLPAAGLPWFMTIFGRDSIFTSLQALPFTPRAGGHHAARPG